jgi:plasmid stabilization system protein ParE
MQLRWSPAAAEDLFRIVEYIRQENAPAAQRIAKTIYESAGSLKSFPNKGRTGRVEGTRELPFRRFLSWWFIESVRILWKSRTSSMAHRNGRQRIERSGEWRHCFSPAFLTTLLATRHLP